MSTARINEPYNIDMNPTMPYLQKAQHHYILCYIKARKCRTYFNKIWLNLIGVKFATNNSNKAQHHNSV